MPMAAGTLYSMELSNREIRLLNISPSGAASQSPLVCELRQYNLEDIPAYEALSYCWGDPSKQCSVVCNGGIYNITASLYNALIRL
jgi:hypothetical protein